MLVVQTLGEGDDPGGAGATAGTGQGGRTDRGLGRAATLLTLLRGLLGPLLGLLALLVGLLGPLLGLLTLLLELLGALLRLLDAGLEGRHALGLGGVDLLLLAGGRGGLLAGLLHLVLELADLLLEGRGVPLDLRRVVLELGGTALGVGHAAVGVLAGRRARLLELLLQLAVAGLETGDALLELGRPGVVGPAVGTVLLEAGGELALGALELGDAGGERGVLGPELLELTGRAVGVRGRDERRHALALADLRDLAPQVVLVLEHATHLGDDVVEEVVDLPLVVATAELGLGERLVENVLGRESHEQLLTARGHGAGPHGSDRILGSRKTQTRRSRGSRDGCDGKSAERTLRLRPFSGPAR